MTNDMYKERNLDDIVNSEGEDSSEESSFGSTKSTGHDDS